MKQNDRIGVKIESKQKGNYFTVYPSALLEYVLGETTITQLSRETGRSCATWKSRLIITMREVTYYNGYGKVFSNFDKCRSNPKFFEVLVFRYSESLEPLVYKKEIIHYMIKK